jgi:N-acetylmuramoyl-L-alanine amidase
VNIRLSRALVACLAGLFVLVLAMLGTATGQQTVTFLWRGESYPVAVSGGDFSVGDAARALGFTVSRDTTSGVLTISGHGHQLLAGPGTKQVPVDQRTVEISRPARMSGGVLYAPPDFFEKALFPIAGASGSYDAGRHVWTLSETGSPPETVPATPVSIDVAVVHVDPTTQVVLRESGPARFAPRLVESGLQIRWLDRKITAPFGERRFDDPLVAAVRFEDDTATVVFRDPGLTAHAYPLTDPDRIVVEVGRQFEAAPIEPAAPAPAAVPAITIVVDPGHGGTETGAVGPGGLQEKDVTLQIARRLAGAIPKVISSRIVLTRDSDSAISLDDRTSLANHEKANLFLSLHANSSRAAGAHGSETYYLSLESSDRLSQEVARRENAASPGGPPSTPGALLPNPDLDFILWDLAQSAHLNESSRLAEAIQTQLNVVSKTENRGIKQAPFRVLAGATMPAVLVEIGFISHSEEEKQLRSAAFQESVADAIAKAVGEFFARRQTGAPAARPTPRATPSPAR